jgi:hypothetical protein
MSGMDFIRETLDSYGSCIEVDGQVAVPTHCLYPSNKSVTVYVTGGPNGARASDEGGALDALSAHQRFVQNPDVFLRRFCKRNGLLVQAGKIVSPPVPMDGLAGAVVMVANASSAAAHWGLEHLKSPHRGNIRTSLHDALKRHFADERILLHGQLAGKSTRQYHFDHIVTLNETRKLVIDAVLPDANSLNSRVVAHIDLAQCENPNIIQRMVYDDEYDWSGAELSLMQMAAIAVPMSRFDGALNRLVVH